MPDTDQREQQNNMGSPEREDVSSRDFSGNDMEDTGNQEAGNNLEQNNNGTRSRSQGTSGRGFAAMNPERQKAIASEGGRAAHRQGVAHEWSREEAREAGRKGGQSVSRNREHMSEIGRKGGQRSGRRRSNNDSAA